jgi:hypothetical protein
VVTGARVAVFSPERNSRRSLVLGCGGLLGLVFLLVAGYLAWANRPLPRPARATRPPGSEGFVACGRAARSLRRAWGREKILTMRASLLRVRPYLDELRRALRLEFVYTPNAWAGEDFHTPVPVWLFVSESRVELADGHPEVAIHRALDAMELGSRAGGGGNLYQHELGMGWVAMALPSAEQCVPRLSVNEAIAARRRLERIIGQFPSLAEVLEVERQDALSLWARLLRRPKSVWNGLRRANGQSYDPNPPEWTSRLLWTLYPKRSSYETLDSWYRWQIRETEKPYGRRLPPPSPPPLLVLGTIDGPVGDASGRKETRCQVRLQLLRLQLALSEYRRRKGEFPQPLEQLVPALLPAVPVDPFAEKPFVYQRRGDGYLLYSLGPDQDDDHGTPIILPKPHNWVGSRSQGDMVAGTGE